MTPELLAGTLLQTKHHQLTKPNSHIDDDRIIAGILGLQAERSSAEADE